ncbi:MAG: PAS domain-containing protein [Candidatus Eisenbacteria bacterium]
MSHPRPTPRDSEREFRVEELFFSTTDLKGHIEAGNATFARIAGYTLSELIGEPHNIIRHPDMPRAVFELLWRKIQAGEPVAAYVKNMAKDGGYYWVMALVLPVDDGYLSVRLKPTSAVFESIPAVYARLLAHEQAVEKRTGKRKESIEAGLSFLQETLAGLGFAEYEDFMWTALRAEMTSREAALVKLERAGNGFTGRIEDPPSSLSGLFARCESLRSGLKELFTDIEGLSSLGGRLGTESQFIRAWAHDIRMMALNAQIQSSQLSGSGEALGVVAEWIGRTSAEASESMGRFDEQAKSLGRPLRHAISSIIAGKLEVDVVREFLLEVAAEADDERTHLSLDRPTNATEKSCAILLKTFLRSTKALPETLRLLERELKTLDAETEEIAKHVRTLELIPLTGKVEAAREEAARSFVTIFETLGSRVEETRVRLESFASDVQNYVDQQRSLQSVLRRVERHSLDVQEVSKAA